jgi:DNA-binding transcriptional LysR family regulator
LPAYPDIKFEIVVDYGLSNIVAEGYDAGVRSGEQVAKDMIAVRIGPDLRMAVVGAPSYFRGRPEPKKPQDLVGHNCINLRLPSHGGVYAWEFEKGGRELKARVEGQMTCNGANQMLTAALAGLGLAYIPEEMVGPHLSKGRLKRVLADWCQPYSGYHLFIQAAASPPRRSACRGCVAPPPLKRGAYPATLVTSLWPRAWGSTGINLSDVTIFSTVALYFREMGRL